MAFALFLHQCHEIKCDRFHGKNHYFAMVGIRCTLFAKLRIIIVKCAQFNGFIINSAAHAFTGLQTLHGLAFKTWKVV